jgi:sRNA-binding protein
MHSERKRNFLLANDIRNYLAANSKLIKLEGQPKLPMKLGIYFDLRKTFGMSAKDIGLFCHTYCSKNSYLLALLQPDAERFNLEGMAVSIVTDNEKDFARQLIMRRLVDVNQQKFWLPYLHLLRIENLEGETKRDC